MSLRLSLLFATLLVFFLVSNSSAQISFDIETVDASGGLATSLALDSEGLPHIAHIKGGGGGLYYVTMFGETWTFERVEGYPYVIGGVTLLLDPAGIPAICNTGRYHTRTGSGWVREDMGGFSPWFSTAALDAVGNARGVTIWSWGSGLYQGFVSYEQRSGDGSWAIENISGAPFIPTNPHASLILDSNGNPHVSVTPSQGEALRYSHYANGAWSTEVFSPGTWSSVAVDDADEPRVSLYDLIAGDLVLAVRSEGAWQTVTIDQEGDVGLYTSHVTRDGFSHISYYDRTSGDLKYAVYGAQGLTIQTVDSEGDVGKWTSLALDADGKPHITYQDATNGALKYAVGGGPVPTEQKTLGGVKWLYRQ